MKKKKHCVTGSAVFSLAAPTHAFLGADATDAWRYSLVLAHWNHPALDAARLAKIFPLGQIQLRQ